MPRKAVFSLLLFLITLLFLSLAGSAQTTLASYDITKIPYSVRGSYLAITRLDSSQVHYNQQVPEGIFIRNIGRRHFYKYLIAVDLLEGDKPVTPVIEADAGQLILRTPHGMVAFTFENPSVIRIKGRGVTLRLRPIDKCYAVPMRGKQWRFLNGQYNDFFYIASSLKGGSYFKPLDKPGLKNPFPNHSDNFFMEFGGIPAQTKNPSDPSDSSHSSNPSHSSGSSHPSHSLHSSDPSHSLHSSDSSHSTDSSGEFEAALEEFVSEWNPRTYTKPFNDCVKENASAFDRWKSKLPVLSAAFAAAGDKATFQNWSAIVAARGLLKREAMFMSKNWMNTYYSWDHCFNAIALAPGQQDAAWDQFAGIFDHQSALGSLPDCVDDEKEAWGIVKTPVHGWALGEMMKIPGMVTLPRMKAIYPHLAAWTNFWFKYRDPDGNKLPQYNHSFESFDDTPPFDVGLPVEGPELATFLILQMNVLEKMALQIGKPADARTWHKRADEVTRSLMDRLWNGETFLSVNALSGDYTKGGESFISYVPLLLGDRLPIAVREKLIARLKKPGGLLTRFGFATESLSSPFFDTNSYTRGSIWGPVNYILVCGLEACHDHVFAKEVAGSYCRHLAETGFPERNDAVTGEPKSDPAYTWTSSIFLILAHRYFPG